MPTYHDLNDHDRDLIDQFLHLPDERQREILAMLFNYMYSDDIAGDFEDLVQEQSQ